MWFSSPFGKRQRPAPSIRTRGSRRKRSTSGLRLEALEGRWLLSAAYNATSPMIIDTNAGDNGRALQFKSPGVFPGVSPNRAGRTLPSSPTRRFA